MPAHFPSRQFFFFLVISAGYYPAFLCAFLAHHCASLVYHFPPFLTPSGLTLGATPPSSRSSHTSGFPSRFSVSIVPDAIRLRVVYLRWCPYFCYLPIGALRFFRKKILKNLRISKNSCTFAPAKVSITSRHSLTLNRRI